MKLNRMFNAPSGTLKCGAVMLSVLQVFATLPQYANAATQPKATTAPSPITHVIVIIGENRSFDHVFGTYVPREDQTISNLWSKGIVNLDGTPGPKFKLSQQYTATITGAFTTSPTKKTLYKKLPPSISNGPAAGSIYGYPFSNQEVGEIEDPDLAPGYDKYLTTGATNIPKINIGTTAKPYKVDNIDTRIANAAAPANGVYQLTGAKMPYDAYTSSPVHRFLQMWQQTDCGKATATADNPSGCVSDLFPFIEANNGTGGNGTKPATPPGGAKYLDYVTGEGSTSMAFYNIYKGDVPYFKELADNYTINDNFHQSVMGGTGANHIMFGYADMIYYSDGKGNAKKPPVNQIEDGTPQAGTNNFYTEDGYGNQTGGTDGSKDSDYYGGGSYINCSDSSEGGVAAINNYLESVDVKPAAPCEAGHYYLVNNYNPGYLGDGTVAPLLQTADTPEGWPFTIPPTSRPSIGDSLIKANVSFKYYGEGYDVYAADPAGENPYSQNYCNICNPFQYETSIMADPVTRTTHIGDTDELYANIAAYSASSPTLESVVIVKPSGYNDGHPASSKLDLFEGFTKKIVDAVKANPDLWPNTAIFITFDEGGGYYDSGYIQPVDFFGDGTRIPLIIVSPYTEGGIVTHEYSDHVSITKFIEKNFGLGPISGRSRDNLPNPKQAAGSYVPTNIPALDDLFDSFQFSAAGTAKVPHPKDSSR